MEEGPEPQELFEQVEQRHRESEADQKGENGEEHNRSGASNFTTRCAITASTLAVLAALGSLLSGHSANEAILSQSQATDQWSYYQAKSTKSHIFEGDRFIIQALCRADENFSPGQAQAALTRFDKMAKQEASQEETIRDQARSLENRCTSEFVKHQDFSYAVACFQIGIVLASISIMVKGKRLHQSSILCGVAGTLLSLVGVLH